MRWPIIRLIWFRELRDQLRDRRTVLMVTVLPVVIYPLLGLGMAQFAFSFLKKTSVVAVVGAENLPPVTSETGGVSPLPGVAAWFSSPPDPVMSGPGAERLATSALIAHLGALGLGQDLPPLLLDGDSLRFPPFCFDSPDDAESLELRPLPPAPEEEDPAEWYRSVLAARKVDLVLVIPPDFRSELEQGRRPVISLYTRPGDDRSRLVLNRVQGAIARWKKLAGQTRLLSAHLPADYDDPIEVRDVAKLGKPPGATEMFTALVRVFPFLLVIWALTGALYPAVDLCAGEKERGTMETLLISPVSREEIVYGKFLTIWVFSTATALVNLASMALTAAPLAGMLSEAGLRPLSVLLCVVLLLPLSAFFSAMCLAVGAYARSSKEGQYYLMPLFLVTMPLVFMTLAPGVELNAFYSMVPVTGVALLLQRMLLTSSLAQVPWEYFVPVLVPMVIYSWLALRWAVSQFQREEVLFREAERLDLGLWLRSIFRDKEPLPGAGLAFFCFGLVVGLRWLSAGFGTRLSAESRSAIMALAFVVAPTLFLAVMLTTRPWLSLALRRPPLRFVGFAALVALLLVPLTGYLLVLLDRYPESRDLFTSGQPLLQRMLTLGQGESAGTTWLGYSLLFLPIVCEELAFRGFILSGLHRRFHPIVAVLLGAFLFALYEANVFQLGPAFLLGIVLGILVLRSGSVVPGIAFRLVHNVVLLATAGMISSPTGELFFNAVTAAAGAAIATWLLARTAYRHFVPVWESGERA